MSIYQSCPHQTRWVASGGTPCSSPSLFGSGFVSPFYKENTVAPTGRQVHHHHHHHQNVLQNKNVFSTTIPSTVSSNKPASNTSINSKTKPINDENDANFLNTSRNHQQQHHSHRSPSKTREEKTTPNKKNSSSATTATATTATTTSSKMSPTVFSQPQPRRYHYNHQRSPSSKSSPEKEKSSPQYSTASPPSFKNSSPPSFKNSSPSLYSPMPLYQSSSPVLSAAQTPQSHEQHIQRMKESIIELATERLQEELDSRTRDFQQIYLEFRRKWAQNPQGAPPMETELHEAVARCREVKCLMKQLLEGTTLSTSRQVESFTINTAPTQVLFEI